MKVELKDAKVELEVGDGKPTVYINGRSIPIPREVGVALIFGDDGGKPATVTHPIKPGLSKTKPTRGCQTAASKRKLSASLKKFYAKKRRKEAAAKNAAPPTKVMVKPKVSGRHLNGASSHHVN